MDRSDLDRADVEGWLVRVLEGLSWLDPDGETSGESPGDVLLCSTFGETLADAVEVQVGRFSLRYPAHTQQRSAGFVAVDPAALTGTIDNLVLELVALRDEDAEAGCEELALLAAVAAQPNGEFKWTGRGVAQAYRVVGEVESWPGEIQLQAARVYEPKIRIGDPLWLADRELLPVCWVLDWLAS